MTDAIKSGSNPLAPKPSVPESEKKKTVFIHPGSASSTQSNPTSTSLDERAVTITEAPKPTLKTILKEKDGVHLKNLRAIPNTQSPTEEQFEEFNTDFAAAGSHFFGDEASWRDRNTQDKEEITSALRNLFLTGPFKNDREKLKAINSELFEKGLPEAALAIFTSNSAEWLTKADLDKAKEEEYPAASVGTQSILAAMKINPNVDRSRASVEALIASHEEGKK